jgi:hypothetical protein
MVKLANTPIICFKKDKKALVLQSVKGKDESRGGDIPGAFAPRGGGYS